MAARAYDIVIAGAGITGLTLAAGLRGSGLRTALIDRQPPLEAGADLSLRVSAINRASLQIFNAVGAFARLPAVRMSPFRDMHVWDSTGVGEIHFSAAELGLDTLGYIVENNVVQHALLDAVREAEEVDWLCPAAISDIAAGETSTVALENGDVLESRLLVGADGARSRVRAAAGIELVRKPYRQDAIVAHVRTERPHDETAWQCFSPQGPLAFLPLADGRSSIVWSLDEGSAAEILALDDAAFSRRLERAFEYRLGGVTDVNERGVFPLGHGHVDHYVKPGVALIGDAAHNIHPLAGQGANLGIRDAIVLADTLKRAAAAGRQWDALHTLRKYERARKGDNTIMENAMTAFKHLFGNDDPLLTEIRNIGLGLVDHATPLKKVLIRHALGEYRPS